MSIGVHYLFELDFSPDAHPGVGLQDHIVTLSIYLFISGPHPRHMEVPRLGVESKL